MQYLCSECRKPIGLMVRMEQVANGATRLTPDEFKCPNTGRVAVGVGR